MAAIVPFRARIAERGVQGGCARSGLVLGRPVQ
jgi:hypothetical protein